MMNNRKILICDDDEGILDMLSLILEDTGLVVIPESNSLKVKSILEAQHPDLIILDLWMPVLSGDQVLKSIRANKATHSIPVIVISASTDGKDIALQAGATDFLAKPFDVDELINMVDSYISPNQ